MEIPVEHFDYIIIGAGCSGLSLAARMIANSKLTNKKILIIDKAPNKGNDKTWCFWDRGNIAAFWEPASVIHHQWSELWLKHPAGNILLDIAPYRYKMIRSDDFYRYCFSAINAAPNVQVHYETVSAIDAEKGIVTTIGSAFKADIIFSSVLPEPPQLQPHELYLLQHFRGWWIETREDFFNPAAADLMNFNTSQEHGCTFVYVLPVSRRRALVEYTLFTEKELSDEQYDEGLRQFIKEEMGLEEYTITQVEQGFIPMTDLQFPQQSGKVFFIGTAGGQTKASTGYTFSFIQKQAAAIVSSIEKTGEPAVYKGPARFRFYDSVLLKVLHERKIKGADVFYRMFKKNKASRVLRFLDNESSLPGELKIMNSTQKRVFIRAAIDTLLRRKRG